MLSCIYLESEQASDMMYMMQPVKSWLNKLLRAKLSDRLCVLVILHCNIQHRDTLYLHTALVYRYFTGIYIGYGQVFSTSSWPKPAATSELIKLNISEARDWLSFDRLYSVHELALVVDCRTFTTVHRPLVRAPIPTTGSTVWMRPVSRKIQIFKRHRRSRSTWDSFVLLRLEQNSSSEHSRSFLSFLTN